MARLVSVLVFLGPCAMLCAACGPSVQSIYEGNVRFEHCYRLDIDPHIAPTHREACWREWKQTYTYGQTRDRVEYAERRIRALAWGDDRRPVLDAKPDSLHRKQDVAPSDAPIPARRVVNMNAHPVAAAGHFPSLGGSPRDNLLRCEARLARDRPGARCIRAPGGDAASTPA